MISILVGDVFKSTVFKIKFLYCHFTKGVKYIYNSDGKCKIDMIDANRDFMVAELGSDGLIKMKNSSEFFHFDGGNFQFSGSVHLY